MSSRAYLRYALLNAQLSLKPTLDPKPSTLLDRRYNVVLLRTRLAYSITIFLGSALLFLVQPMIAKMLLPYFGGSASVWLVSMVFFQAVLLLGYLYAHCLSSWLGTRRSALVHLVLLAGAALTLPFTIPAGFNPTSGANPAGMLLTVLGASVGAAFFAISAGAPLLQRWFASTGHPDGNDPYFLYAASNFGSLLALLAYPLLIEPSLTLQAQRTLWALGYAALLLLIAVCAFVVWRSKNIGEAVAETQAESRGSARERLTWTALAAVPSSLLLAVTAYITSNIAPVPLLWVIPLALYLVTFIFAFAKRQVLTSSVLSRILALLTPAFVLMLVLESSTPLIPVAGVHMLVFFIAAWMCHRRLAETRPEAGRLTGFYFFMALGGVIGGAFNALLAPVLFDSLAEYPIAVTAALLLRPRAAEGKGSNWDYIYPVAVGLLTVACVLGTRAAGMEPGPLRTALTIGLPVILSFLAVDRPLRSGLAYGAIFLVSSLLGTARPGELLAMERSFYGVHRVMKQQIGSNSFVLLTQGDTTHGMQNVGAPETPLTYYHPTGPIGQLFQSLRGNPVLDRVALVGLGAGSLAAYAEPGQNFVYYEIDPAVIDIAQNRELFRFLSDSKAKPEMVLGDARLSLQNEREGKFGLIVLDAFSSDSVPAHLLTVEAIAMYLSKLESGGLLAFHISNRYLALDEVLASAAKELHLAGVVQNDIVEGDERYPGKTSSSWVVLARSREDLRGMDNSTYWDILQPTKNLRPWTDDFSNVLSAFQR